MVDVVPVVLLAFGVVAVLKPEWVVAVDRRQKAAGTTRDPEDVEMTDGHYLLVQVAGFFLAVFGFVFALRSL